jgi:hypothetical protein
LKEEHVRFGGWDAAENSEYNRHAVRRIERRRERSKKRKSATGNIILGQKLFKSKSSSTAWRIEPERREREIFFY